MYIVAYGEWVYFTKSKERGEVVGSLPTHKINASFRRRKCHIYGMVRVIYPISCFADRNNLIMMKVPLTLCSESLSIVGISYYYGGLPYWNPECFYFCCLKCQYNGALLHRVGLGFSDRPSSSTISSGGRGEEYERIYVVQYFLRI